VIVELHGLEVFGHHGVLESEQREGQAFLYDVTLEIDDPTADRVQETVDYRAVAARVAEVSDSTRFALIESLSAAVAEALLASFPAANRVGVRVRKPRPAGIAAEWSAATAERSR
jgi:dihydroneopterin aldolase